MMHTTRKQQHQQQHERNLTKRTHKMTAPPPKAMRQRRQQQQQQQTRIRSVLCASLFLLLLPVFSNAYQQQQQQTQTHQTQRQQQQSIDTCSSYATPVVRHGTKFFNKLTGAYMPIKGINYYPRPNTGIHVQTNSVDFLTESFRHVWERDIQYFQSLNVNVIRIYAVAPGLDHSGFMCACQAAGIYLIIGLAADCEDCAITKYDAPDCYPSALKTRGQFIIAEFARYDNVIAFSAGNEISLSSANGALTNGVCQKKFIQDMREYISSCGSTIRHIPVGLAAADIDRTEKALYYSCHDTGDENDMSSAEFIGMNSYLHCDGTLNGSESEPLVGFETLLKDFASYQVGVPVILTEFGCIDGSFDTINDYDAQRNFLQVDALFSERYRDEFAGGIVFEYSTELVNSLAPYPFDVYGEGNFGIGYLSPENCNDIDILCDYIPFPQFNTLATKYNAIDISTEPSLDEYILSYQQTSAPVCPAEFPSSLDSFVWPSDSIENRECPGQVWVTCDAVPAECSNLGMLLFDDSNSNSDDVTNTKTTEQPTKTPSPTSVPSTIPPVEPSFGPTSKPSSTTMPPTTISPTTTTTTATVPPTTPTTNTTFETIEETPAVDDEPDDNEESTSEEDDDEEASSSAVGMKMFQQQWITRSVMVAAVVVVVSCML